MNDKDPKLTDEHPRLTFPLGRELRKRILHAIMAETSDQAKLAMRVTSIGFKVEGQLAARKRQSQSAAKRHENLEARDRWIREEWANAKKNDPTYSIKRLRKKLMKSWKFRKEMRHDRKFLSAERLRIIITER